MSELPSWIGSPQSETESWMEPPSRKVTEFSMLAVVTGRRRFPTVDAQRDQLVWSPSSGDEWLRSLDQPPNPLWPSQREIITQALGPAAESYLAYMLNGVQTAGYEYRCPTVFVVASK